jgi:hypothetical protein
MTPKQHLAQRKSWVVGELMLSHPEMTRDEAAKIYERAVSRRDSTALKFLASEWLAAGRAC